MVSRKASQKSQHVEPWGRWATTEEDHIRICSCLPRTCSPKLDSWRLVKDQVTFYQYIILYTQNVPPNTVYSWDQRNQCVLLTYSHVILAFVTPYSLCPSFISHFPLYLPLRLHQAQNIEINEDIIHDCAKGNDDRWNYSRQ